MSAFNIENIGKLAVKQLRKDKLANGLTFMINSKELPNGEAYLEYPNGKMALITAHKDASDFTFIRHLSQLEAKIIREKLNL